MNQYFKKTLGIFSIITGLMLSTPIFGSGYYIGSESEEILLNGKIIFSGIGSSYNDVDFKFIEKEVPIFMIKYKKKLYRCHIILNFNLNSKIPQQDHGFEVYCWGRKK